MFDALGMDRGDGQDYDALRVANTRLIDTMISMLMVVVDDVQHRARDDLHRGDKDRLLEVHL